MIRIALLSLLLAACQASTAAPPVPVQAPAALPVAAPAPVAPAPRNFVCERLALENSKAPCVPELTDAGDLHTHTARITLDGQVIVCALNSAQVSVACGPMFMAPQQPQEQVMEATKPAAKVPAKK